MLDQHRDAAFTSTDHSYENADWCLLSDGLEHRATGYFIARDSIAMRRGNLWEWPLHLAEKSWCSARSFREAFMAAVSTFDVPTDAALERSFVAGFGRVAGAAPQVDPGDFVSLGSVIRPKSADLAPIRKRSMGGESRAALVRRAAIPVSQRVSDGTRQRATS